jgi:Sporulation and spore germination
MSRSAVAIAVVAALLIACRPEGVTLVSRSELPREVYGSPLPTPSVTPEQEVPETGFVYLVNERGRLVRRERALQPAGSLQEALMVALIFGPRAREPLTTTIPLDTTLRGVEVGGTGVATVDLSAAFERPGSQESLDLRIAQVVYTLTQQPASILAVRFEIDGEPQPVLQPDRPATRGDFEEFAPRGEASGG